MQIMQECALGKIAERRHRRGRCPQPSPSSFLKPGISTQKLARKPQWDIRVGRCGLSLLAPTIQVSNKVRGFVGLEESCSLFRFTRNALGVRKAIGQAGKKLSGEVLSGWGWFGHRSSR